MELDGSLRTLRRYWIWIAVVLIAVAGLLALRRGSGGESGELSADGIGPLRIGMSFTEAVQTGWADDETVNELLDGTGCYHGGLTPEAGEAGGFDESSISLFYIDDRLVRITLSTAEGQPPTVSGGVEIGASAADVEDAFGDEIDEVEQDEGVDVLRVADDDRGLDFVLDDGRDVTAIRSGSLEGLTRLECV